MDPFPRADPAQMTSLRFPPLGNAMLARIGTADVGADQVFLAIREHLVDAPAGPAELAGSFLPWLSVAVQTANDQSYRFELRGIDPDSTTVEDLGSVEARTALGALPLGLARGTAKLVVLLGLDGTGTTTLSAHGLDQGVDFSAGTLAIGPAYLALVTEPPTGPLRCLRAIVHGPAFR